MQALNPTDSFFLWMETRTQPMHVAGLNLFTPPPNSGPNFVSELVDEWRKHVTALSPFNLRPTLRMGLWYWEEDTEFELDYHLRHLALPKPGRIRELLAMVSRLHGNLMDRNRPLWECYVIEGLADGRFAIYMKIHHALIDGVTGAKMMAEGLAHSAAEIKPPLWAYPFKKYNSPSKPSRARSLMQQLTYFAKAGSEILPGIRSGILDMLRSTLADTAAALPFQAPPSPFNVDISGSRRFAAQSYSLSRIKRIGEAAGATVNDVTLAICAGALRQYMEVQKVLPRKPLVAMVPVSLHGETNKSGNQVGVLLANLATNIKDPLKRLQRIVESTKEAKDKLSSMSRLRKLAHGITSISAMGPAMMTGSARNHPIFNLVISNVPGPKDPLYLNGARLDEVYPLSIPTHYLALNITISGYQDTMGFGYIACRRSVPALQRMLDYTDQSILALENALGIRNEADSVAPVQAAKKVTKPRRTSVKADKNPNTQPAL